MHYQPIDLQAITARPFQKFDKEWAALCAGQKNSLNAMTVSWGTFGTLWGKPITTVFARPQRYTREFLERESYYSLSFFDSTYREQLAYIGSVSGRDEDKLLRAGFTAAFDAPAPYFTQANFVLICKKLYFDDIKPENFICTDIAAQHYAQKDFHRFYIGEVVQALQAG